ncbi:MAG: hypothetical protein WCW77_00670 [Patescibacteria group bacterium]
MIANKNAINLTYTKRLSAFKKKICQNPNCKEVYYSKKSDKYCQPCKVLAIRGKIKREV